MINQYSPELKRRLVLQIPFALIKRYEPIEFTFVYFDGLLKVTSKNYKGTNLNIFAYEDGACVIRYIGMRLLLVDDLIKIKMVQLWSNLSIIFDVIVFSDASV